MIERRAFVAIIMLVAVYYYKITLSQRIDGPIVTTRNGQIKGVVSFSRGGRKYYEYLGIPYAKPPIGDLRFEPPQPSEKWEGIRDTGEYGAQCIQLELLFGLITGNEDCLFVNIFTPKEKPIGKKLPVMFYIHGGLFINGGSDLWRPTYFMDEDVILVTINYRLAALGFLNTGDGIVRGNMGLKDQSLALRWVRDNINQFGGDPNRVTIFGESAGGCSAHFHMLSPMSKGLFHRAISQSGTALHFWTINSDKDPKEQSQRFGRLLGCPTEDSRKMIDCMKKLDATEIVEIHREILDPLRDHVTMFKPTVEVIDDELAFLTESPTELVKSGKFNKVPWITGVNSEEGLVTSSAIMANKTMQQFAKEEWSEFSRRLLLLSKNDSVAKKIKEFYFGDANDQDIGSFDNLDKYTDMISDRGFFVDIHHGAKLQAKFSPVYLYYYSYPGEWTVASLFMEVRGQLPRIMEAGWAVISSWVNRSLLGRSLPNYGTSHGDELALFFQMPWISDILPESRDYQMSMDLVKLWTSFADKRTQLKFRNVVWEPIVTSKEKPLKYLKLDEKPQIIEEPFAKRVEFWDSLEVNNKV